MNFTDIRIEQDGKIGIILLNRPEQHNSLRGETMAQLCQAIDLLEADAGVGAILLAAEGRHFCAGAEFAYLETLKTTSAIDVRDRIYAHFQGAARRLFRFAKPTVAAVGGAAITVGCELALACDFRIGTEKSLFQESWIKLGLLPPLGGMFLLPRIVGLTRANEMILRGRAVRGEEALRIGLVSELVAPEALRARGVELAAELAELPPRAYALAKEGLQRGMESSIDREWAAGVLAQAMLIGTEDFREGLDAVTQKRAPRFTGR